jgi:hypothetical protein
MIFPEDLLEFQRISRTQLTEKWIALDGVLSEPGTVTIGGFNAEAIVSNGSIPILEAVLRVKENVNGRGEFDLVNFKDDLSGASVKKGSTGVSDMPGGFALFQNYPNPFNPVTSVAYSLREVSKVRVEVYNTLGQVVAVLVDGQQETGSHQVEWNASQMTSGVYFCRLTTGHFTAMKRMVLLR